MIYSIHYRLRLVIIKFKPFMALAFSIYADTLIIYMLLHEEHG